MHVACPCGFVEEMPDTLAGQTITCPKCQASLPLETDLSGEKLFAVLNKTNPQPRPASGARVNRRALLYGGLTFAVLLACVVAVVAWRHAGRSPIRALMEKHLEASVRDPGSLDIVYFGAKSMVVGKDKITLVRVKFRSRNEGGNMELKHRYYWVINGKVESTPTELPPDDPGRLEQFWSQIFGPMIEKAKAQGKEAVLVDEN